MSYTSGEQVESIAQRLIPKHHSEIADARIKYIFKEKGSKKGNKIVYGSAKKCSALMDYFIDADFLIEVALDAWNELSESKRVALVDHLLERCTGEEDEETGGMKWKVRDPDVHEFSTILKRHGAWTTTLTEFVSVAQSVDLSFMTASQDPTTVN